MEVIRASSKIKALDPRGGHNRYSCNFDFFKEWTSEMAYVLGFLYADGNLVDAKSSRTQYIDFCSRDRSILEKIKLALDSKHPIRFNPPREIVHKDGKVYRNSGLFRLRIGSRIMYADLMRLGLTPRKSLTIEFPDNIPDGCSNHFVRGYFDGDGCVTVKRGVGKHGQSILKGLAVIFTSGSKLFLEGLKDRAMLIGFKRRRVYYGHSSHAYYLKYDTLESLKWFKLFYGHNLFNLFLERKFNVFKRYFQERPIRVDNEIANILRPRTQVV